MCHHLLRDDDRLATRGARDGWSSDVDGRQQRRVLAHASTEATHADDVAGSNGSRSAFNTIPAGL